MSSVIYEKLTMTATESVSCARSTAVCPFVPAETKIGAHNSCQLSSVRPCTDTCLPRPCCRLAPCCSPQKLIATFRFIVALCHNRTCFTLNLESRSIGQSNRYD
ncbi:hypothetical protein J6590_076700 [Homalodisca vitripennis]|nr:hypothetical protein J6590_076700 [Homalodisca vitripennis]